MTEGGKKTGFSGLDSLVSDVEKGLRDAESSSRQQKQTQSRSQTATERPQTEPKPTHAKQTRRPAPPLPVDTGGGTGKIWLGIAGIVIFVIWVSSQDGGSGRTTAPSEPSFTSPSTSRPQTSPALPVLATPPVDTNHVHSRSEIRYCIAADIRIEALRPRMNTNDQVDAFNGIITDYNGRCGSYRYREGEVERAKREIEPYRSTIVANAWDGVFLATSGGTQQKPPVQRSQLTTDIQKALSALGYDAGVADGIYGARTKSAIQAFQRDSGLSVDGLESQDLLRELRNAMDQRQSRQTSASAATALRAKPPAAAPQGTRQGSDQSQESSRSLTVSERESIESACYTDKLMNGPAAYNRCLSGQLATLSRQGPQPDISGLSRSERESIESACYTDKLINGPAAFNTCLGRQLAALRR